jgi:glycosyltransferase involved in cell wall biosynthesis
MSAERPLTVCYFGTYRAEYSRNQIMIQGLRRSGVQVIECHAPLWTGIEDRVQAASGGWLRPGFLRRVFSAYGQLIRQHARIPDYDVLVVGYPGQLDVFLARLLAWRRGRPLAWDVFMSIYLIALERGLEQRSPLTIRLLGWIERTALRLPDCLVHDTRQYAGWLSDVHGIPAGRFHLVPTGADDRVFQPVETAAPARPGLRLLYYGSFIPNHGVLTILEAARLLAGRPEISFELIGDGPERSAAERLARQYALAQVEFLPWMSQSGVVARAARADVLLGAFGVTPQSMMTVQNKIYEGLAMGRPVLTGDSPAVRDALTHGEQVYLCPRQDPASLAEAILALANDPALRQRLGQNGLRAFRERYSLDRIGQRFAEHLRLLVRM